ncbi:hypothetical protein B566_EDAN006424 [Ephemera danica]|nr:hypothetical protein B566_EDAN006424 [Ephemera danica]
MLFNHFIFTGRILYDIPCKVCQDHSSGKHYGIFACDGCAGFFKRSIRRNRQYVCKAKSEGSCVVDKTHRNQCRACRLRKCLDAGMNKDAVQHERGPRNSTLRRQMCLYFKDSNSPPATPGSPPMQPAALPPLPPTPTAPSTSVLDLALPKPPATLEEPPPSSRLLDPAALLCASIKTEGVAGPLAAETVCEAAARLLFMNVKWARGLPAFTALPLRDQMLLLEESWRELFVLGAAQFSLPLEPLAAALQATAESSSSPNSSSSPPPLLAELRALQETQAKYRLVGVDHNEYACLRAIVLFKTAFEGEGCNKATLRESGAVAALQDHTQLTLSRYITCAYPAQPFRFGKLLLLLPALRAVSCRAIEALFFRRTIGDIPIERIICDMYKSSDL